MHIEVLGVIFDFQLRRRQRRSMIFSFCFEDDDWRSWYFPVFKAALPWYDTARNRMPLKMMRNLLPFPISLFPKQLVASFISRRKGHVELFSIHLRWVESHFSPPFAWCFRCYRICTSSDDERCHLIIYVSSILLKICLLYLCLPDALFLIYFACAWQCFRRAGTSARRDIWIFHCCCLSSFPSRYMRDIST